MSESEINPTPARVPAVVDRGPKLTAADMAAALTLRDKGQTQQEIADVLGVSQSQISRVLTQFGDTRALAKSRLHAKADRIARTTLKAVDKAAEQGNANPGLELLDRLDIAKKSVPDVKTDSRIMIVVGAGTQAQVALPELPVIDVPLS